MRAISQRFKTRKRKRGADFIFVGDGKPKIASSKEMRKVVIFLSF